MCLKLIDNLQRPLRNLGLVRGVGGHKLRSADNGPDSSRDEMVIDAAAGKAH